MGCILGKSSKKESQPSNEDSRKQPPHEVGFSFPGSSEIKILLAARTSDFHGYAVADIPAVLQRKGEWDKFVPAYAGGFTNLGTSILCQRVLGNWKGWNLEAKAKASGASQLVAKDLKEEFYQILLGLLVFQGGFNQCSSRAYETWV